MDAHELPGWGVDVRAQARPGVPHERVPRPAAGAHIEPPRQEPRVPVLHRREVDQLPVVFGTAQPPRGMSGLVRRLAYRLPEHGASHWMLLLFADRVDVLEHRLTKPASLAAAGAMAVGGVWLTRKLRRGRAARRSPRRA